MKISKNKSNPEDYQEVQGNKPIDIPIPETGIPITKKAMRSRAKISKKYDHRGNADRVGVSPARFGGFGGGRKRPSHRQKIKNNIKLYNIIKNIV